MNSNSVEKNIRCISHEINNSLSICDIYTGIIRKTLEKENYSNTTVFNALNCVEQSLKIINGEMTVLRSIKSENLQQVSLNCMINDTINLSMAYIRDKNIQFKTDLGEDVLLYADECKFKAVLINLFKNGIEAIKEKGFIYTQTEKKEDKILINIGNTGNKITSPEKLFTPLFTTKRTGSGIGLYMCRQTIEEMQGRIKLLSSTSKKTIFQIELPLRNPNL